MEFTPFPKISRLNREVVITEKIDGTNAQIYIAEGPWDDDAVARQGPPGETYLQMFAGSRSRWLLPGREDNFGFAAWAAAHAEELFSLGHGRHFGEWWGAGIQRRYGLGEKRFSLFNTNRWGPMRDMEKHPVDAPACCRVVPVLYAGPFNTLAICAELATLRERGSVAAPGFMQPEGIVVFHTASSTLYKVTLEKDAQHKGENS